MVMENNKGESPNIKATQAVIDAMQNGGECENDGRKKNTGIACKIPNCGGKIIKETFRQYLGDPMHRIIGRGGERQMTATTELYCSECGVSYHHLPK